MRSWLLVSVLSFSALSLNAQEKFRFGVGSSGTFARISIPAFYSPSDLDHSSDIIRNGGNGYALRFAYHFTARIAPFSFGRHSAGFSLNANGGLQGRLNNIASDIFPVPVITLPEYLFFSSTIGTFRYTLHLGYHLTIPGPPVGAPAWRAEFHTGPNGSFFISGLLRPARLYYESFNEELEVGYRYREHSLGYNLYF